jgi:ABC-type glutathione transport system ATPase component
MHGAVNLRSPIALASDGEPELQNRIAEATQLERDHGAPISIRNLSMRFGKLLAVDNVSLEIPNGQFVSIVGPSGCGKTTVLNTLTGLLPITEGDISLRGRRPVAGNPDVAYMLARDSLLPWRTAVGNVQYGMEIRGVGGAEREALAREQLRRVGLGKFADVYPKMLSHGIAPALRSRPDVLPALAHPADGRAFWGFGRTDQDGARGSPARAVVERAAYGRLHHA